MTPINRADNNRVMSNVRDWTVAIIFGVIFGVMYSYAVFGTYF